MATGNHYSSLVAPVIDIAQQAAHAIVEIYNQGFTVHHKADNSPVTEADLAADRIITDCLARMTPNWPVLSEEGNVVDYEKRAQWQRYWLVDPLDGTREFVNRNDEFTVNIALIDNGVPQLGVIVAPVSGVCYYGCRGYGAFKQAPDRAPEPIRVRRWNGKRLTVAGSRSHRSPRFRQFLGHFKDYSVISLGSSLKSCYVAEGRADIYVRLGPTAEWDTAAAQCIVEEAGGRMTDTTMRSLRYNTKPSLINPFFLVFGDQRYDWGRYAVNE